jgi:hypothetical protein
MKRGFEMETRRVRTAARHGREAAVFWVGFLGTVLLWKKGFGGGAESNTRGRVCYPEKRKVAHHVFLALPSKMVGKLMF